VFFTLVVACLAFKYWTKMEEAKTQAHYILGLITAVKSLMVLPPGGAVMNRPRKVEGKLK
jgi:hypothetical protein